MARQMNHGLRKRCDCERRAWPKCRHSWHLNFKWEGRHYRISIDKHVGQHVDSKTAATEEAERIRQAIRAGTFGRAAPVASMTLRRLAALYLERYVEVEHLEHADEYRWALNLIARTELPGATDGKPLAFGDWRVADIVTDTLERFRQVRRGQGAGPVAVNRNLRRLRALFNWALRVGYVEKTPFRRGTENVVRLEPEAARSRRLDADTEEEGRLLKACKPHLRAVVECAIETGMRRGEILSLQWSQVEGLTIGDDGATLTWDPRPAIVLPWMKTKTKTTRRIPISTRLRGVLELRRFGPDGKPLPPGAYVFGNEIGERVSDVGRAWERAVLLAHDHPPEVTDTGNLKPCCREAFAAINLHLHDLRREAGSRWLEGGVPLHVVRDWLGHTSIAQTSTYLAGTLKTAHDAMAQYEAHLAAVQRCATDSGTRGRKAPHGATMRAKKPRQLRGGAGRAVN